MQDLSAALARQQLLDRATALLSGRAPIYLHMRAMEAQRGFRVIAPGQAPWLPAKDWHESCVVSIDGGEVRLVAITARRTGAFRRLLTCLSAYGLRPVVVAPIGPIMPAILKHLKWKRREVGSGIDAEEQWRPR